MRGAPGPFSYIDMGGMFTVLKVRDNPSAGDAAGWYKYPPGTVASEADAARLSADGVDVNAKILPRAHVAWPPRRSAMTTRRKERAKANLKRYQVT